MLSMLIFAAATAAPSPVIIANTSSASQPGVRCAAGDGVQAVGQKSAGVGVQKLNELPNANEYRAVLRRDANGCDKPLIVNYDIGSAPRKQR